MNKKITVYILALESVIAALPTDSVKETEKGMTAKADVEIDGVKFTSKRQAEQAQELLNKFNLESSIITTKRTISID